MNLARELAATLADEPRWIDTRGMLLSDHATITGGTSEESGFVVRVVHGALSAISVVGRPPCPSILAAIDGTTEMTPIVAQTGEAPHIARCLQRTGDARWKSERAILHLLQAPAARAVPSAGIELRLLRAEDSLDHLPAGLRHEMTHARLLAPVGVAVVDGCPASFCYPVWTTERLWDVSIDTLDGYRGRALGARIVWFMIDLMRRQGREPVWGALESNAASLRLAEELGFKPIDQISVFWRGRWAYLTAGFAG